MYFQYPAFPIEGDFYSNSRAWYLGAEERKGGIKDMKLMVATTRTELKVIKLTEWHSLASLRSRQLVEVKLLAILDVICLQNRPSFLLREYRVLFGLLHLQRAQSLGLHVLNISFVHLALHYESLLPRLQEARHHVELLVHFCFFLEHVQCSLLVCLGERLTDLVQRTNIRRTK